MPKRAVFTDLELSIDNTVSIFWNSPLLDYEFVCLLNKHYRLQLSRQTDVDMFNGSHYPFFSYYDTPSHLLFAFVSLDLTRGSISPLTDPYDKVLIISGRDASEQIDAINQDILESPDDSPLSIIRSTLVLQHCYDFTGGEPRVTVLEQEKAYQQDNPQLELFPEEESIAKSKMENRLKVMVEGLQGVYAAVENHLNNLNAADDVYAPIY